MNTIADTPLIPDSLYNRDPSHRILHNNYDVGWIHAQFKRYVDLNQKKRPSASPAVRVSFNLILEGTAIYSNSEGNDVTLHPGHFVLYVPGRTCSLWHESIGTSGEFFFSLDKCTSESFLNVNLLPPIEIGFWPVTQPVLHEVLHLMNSIGKPEYELSTDAIIRILIAFLGKLAHFDQNQSKLYRGEEEIRQACQILEMPEHYTTEIEKVARIAGVEYQRFRRVFRKRMGCSPKEYQIYNRIRSACNLLRKGISVKEVAFMLQYCDPYTFSFQFKKYMGMAPSEYRRFCD